MPGHQFFIDNSATAIVEFHSTTQTVAQFGAFSTKAGSVIRGGTGSLLIITGGCKKTTMTEGFAGMECSMPIDGALTIHMTGTGRGNNKSVPDGTNDTYVLKGKDFKSCGNLEVSGGSLELAALATWKNGTNFIVRGTGTLRLAGAKQLNQEIARLHLADEGKLFLGGNQYMMSAEITDAEGNSQAVANGWYDVGKPGPFAGRFAEGSAGRLRVGVPGTILFIK